LAIATAGSNDSVELVDHVSQCAGVPISIGRTDALHPVR
jgi:hypothetical protein